MTPEEHGDLASRLNEAEAIALETLELAKETKDMLTQILKQVDEVVNNVGPLVEQVSNSPMFKMLGGGRKRG